MVSTRRSKPSGWRATWSIMSASRTVRVHAGHELFCIYRFIVPTPILTCAAWGTGREEMRILKDRLIEMVPSAKVFLESLHRRSNPSPYLVVSHTRKIHALDSEFGAPPVQCG